MKFTGLIALALAAVMAASCGRAREEATDLDNDTADAIGTAGDAIPGSVQNFVRDASMAGTAEVELGKLAAERGMSAQVKEFGQLMVTDHTRAGDELKQAVAPYNLEAPVQMDEKHSDLANRLRGMSGNAFDREYMNAMVEGHENVKDMLEGRANEAPNNGPAENAVNAWAAKTLPTVSRHLDMAKQIKDRLDNTSRNATN